MNCVRMGKISYSNVFLISAQNTIHMSMVKSWPFLRLKKPFFFFFFRRPVCIREQEKVRYKRRRKIAMRKAT